MQIELQLQDHYEELLNYVAEVRESLDVLHEYLNCTPSFSDKMTYYDLIGQHGANFAVLNLVMYRLDDLIKDHNNRLDDYVKNVRADDATRTPMKKGA